MRSTEDLQWQQWKAFERRNIYVIRGLEL